jgi:tripartite-type tricarboxylate transporter receptor subunit TctC
MENFLLGKSDRPKQAIPVACFARRLPQEQQSDFAPAFRTSSKAMQSRFFLTIRHSLDILPQRTIVLLRRTTPANIDGRIHYSFHHGDKNMRLNTSFCALALGVASLVALPAGALAQSYPNKPVTIVVPYAAGGATDVIARLIGEGLSESWKQPVLVSNRSGAGTVIGATHVAKSAGDGYTLYMTTAAHTISASLYKTLPYSPVKDFAPINLASVVPLVLVTGSSLDVKNLQDLLRVAKVAPGMTIASPGSGSPQHLAGALLQEKANITLTHVPYRGDAPMLADLIGGQVQMAFVTLSSALPHIKTGKIKPVALAHPRRADVIADVPTFTEAGLAGFQAATWFGLFSPASMPADLRDKIYQAASRVVSNPELKAKLIDMGGDVVNLSPTEFAGFIDDEVKKWSDAVRLSGAQVN